MEVGFKGTVASSELVWTEMRWDTPDVTAMWKLDDSQRNVHGWLGGDWPVFSLRFEGAAWQDDEQRLRRRVVFLSGPASALRVTNGGMLDPQIEVSGSRESLTKELQMLVARLQNVQLRDVPWQHSLQPIPSE
jgi:hypothetical protein